MKRTISTIFISLLLCIFTAFPVAAVQDADYSRLIDDAMLLYDTEAEEISQKLDEVSEEYECDVIIVTVYSLDGKSAQEYADDFYDVSGYGFGDEHDGILFLLAMEDRDWAITTTGYGITAFTDAGQSYIMDNIMSSLGEDDYYMAFSDFAYYCSDLLMQARQGTPYDVSSTDDGDNTFAHIIFIPISIILGLIIALFIKKSKRKSLKNVRFKKDAADYTAPGSLNIIYQTDNFVSRTVNRVPKPKDNDMGGSSTHVSSSGVTHGGSSGKF